MHGASTQPSPFSRPARRSPSPFNESGFELVYKILAQIVQEHKIREFNESSGVLRDGVAAGGAGDFH